MPQAPYKFTDKRERMGYSGGSRLFEYTDRQSERNRGRVRFGFGTADVDTRMNVGAAALSEIRSASRLLFARCLPLRGAILQMSEYAIGSSWTIMSRSEDKSWGGRMMEAIAEHNRICDWSRRFDYTALLKMAVVSIIRDGDFNAGLVSQPESDYPFIQPHGAHRIKGENAKADGGPVVCSGVILDDYTRAIGYRIPRSDEPGDNDDIPADAFIQKGRLENLDQIRAFPWLSAAINDGEDASKIREYLLTALKGTASRVMLEHNESGQGPDNPTLGGPLTKADAGAVPVLQRMDGGTILYARAGIGAKIDIPTDNRPSQNSMEFSEEIYRGMFFGGLGWPFEMYNAIKTGGAVTRAAIAHAMRTLENLQGLAEHISRRFDIWRIVKLSKLGVIPGKLPADFYKFDYRKPRALSVDNGRDIKADLQALESGAMTFQEWYGEFGQDAKEQLSNSIQFRKWFNAECAANDVDPDRIIPPPQRGGAPNQQGQEPAPAPKQTP